VEPNGSDLSKQARGRWGERLAASHYRRRGYEVVERNWRCPAGELDLVVRVGRTIVFVEVKARRSADFGGAVAAVDHRKQLRLRRLAAAWLAANDVRGVDVRFDVVAIDGVAVSVIEAAF
jgi:putative endonuclease